LSDEYRISCRLHSGTCCGTQNCCIVERFSVHFSSKAMACCVEKTNVNSPEFFLLELYGINVRLVAPFGSASSKQFVDPALIHQVLPDELLFEILSKMTPYTLGRATCVCRKWRYIIRNLVFWRNACLKAWQVPGTLVLVVLLALVSTSGKIVFVDIHFDIAFLFKNNDIYVSQNTYIRAMVADWKITNPVHIVEAALLYPGTHPTLLRFRLRYLIMEIIFVF
ncbi:hypothetical protein MTR67_006995, partial [Solanum verrucosum]